MSRSRRSSPSRKEARSSPAGTADAREIDRELLRRWPLPQPDPDGDKEERGRVLVVGGSREMPGAVLLAAVAALRAGAGKLRIATVESAVPWVATAVPESRVYGLPETEEGAIAPGAAERLVELASHVQSVVVGPGMIDECATSELVRGLLAGVSGPTIVLDAAAMACLGQETELLHGLGGQAVITPHAGEMASCLQAEKTEVAGSPLATARRAAAQFRCVVALKGAETVIAGADGAAYRNRAGNVGLATSGSGDTLAGIIGGLAARGAEPLQAAVWGVHLHARAGDRLARRVGPLGFLARELLAEIPLLMARLHDGRQVKRGKERDGNPSQE